MGSSEEKVFCQITQEEIIRLICEDVSTAAEEMQPARFAPEEFRRMPNWKEICMNCTNHPE